MAFRVEKKLLNGIVVIEPDVYEDDRGFFIESFREDSFNDFGIKSSFVQENHSRSSKNVLRGMHFQWDKPMGKLLRVTHGSIKLVEVDLRVDSPTLGQHITLELNEFDRRIVWIPPGFANGFLVTSERADVQYKCTAYYNKESEGSIRWNSCGIDWGIDTPILSSKDSLAMSLDKWLTKPESQYFHL